MPGDYEIRTMTRPQVDLAVDWAAREGWNPGLHDADCFFESDRGGFLAGWLDGEPVATISAVRYGETFAFVGFYIVEPRFRGRGFGLRLWNAAMAGVAGRNVGLDGVVDQQDNYRKSGFRLAWRNIRYEGAGGGDAGDTGVEALAAQDFPEVDAYDRPFFPDRRDRFLRAWLALPGSVVAGIRERGRLVGYGVIRPCRNGSKIGPLFADSAELAERLFDYLRAQARVGQPVFLDIPQTNPAARDLVERHGMRPMFETARMYTGAFPDLPAARLFGITTFELG